MNYNQPYKKYNEYKLANDERLFLLTLRKVNKMYNVVGDTNTHFLDFIKEMTNHYEDVIEWLKQSDKYKQAVEDHFLNN